MRITNVRILLPDPCDTTGLMAGGCIVFDREFVLNEVKMVAGLHGPFLTMPTRWRMDHCPNPKCRKKNQLLARFCNWCGGPLAENRGTLGSNGRIKLEDDIAHPLDSVFRHYMTQEFLARLEEEREHALQPNYKPTYSFQGD